MKSSSSTHQTFAMVALCLIKHIDGATVVLSTNRQTATLDIFDYSNGSYLL
eukprot:SAG31_NODE_32957_length_349_cov_1.492000_2_plen_50_part_01